MEARHLLLMILDACGKKIESKTKLHKIAYFVSIILKKDFQFNAYFYGPYSRTIENGLEELTGVGFINMYTSSFGITSTTGFEKKKYTYEITESGDELLRNLKTQYAKEYKQIETYSGKLHDKSYIDLSIAAKAFFILDKGKKTLGIEQIRSKAREFQWNITDSEIESAIKILKDLNLISH